MRSPVLMLFLMLLLLSPSTLLAQGKGQGQGQDKALREEATEVKRPERAKKSKAHQKHAKKKGATKGEKQEQYRAISHKNPEKH